MSRRSENKTARILVVEKSISRETEFCWLTAREKDVMDPYKQGLVDWKPDGGFSPQSDLSRRRFTQSDFHWLPSKTELREKGLESLLEGWTPPKPIIDADTRVIALGSCFAANFIVWLAEHGFNQSLPQSPYNALIRNGSAFENASVIAQQFRWAFGEFDSGHALWIDTNRELFEATEERRILVRKTLEQTDVLIMTLGLSEVWFDEATGEAFWRTIPEKYYDPQRHVFKVESVANTVSALLKIHELRRQYLPNLKIVFTISPVKLKATFRPISAITANNASKAILRAALDEFLRSNWTEVNNSYFYFPSYEMVIDVFANPFCDDNRHLHDFVPKRILDTFARFYTTYAPSKSQSGQETEKSIGEEQEMVVHFESKIAELQQTCGERLEVISQLERIAGERLVLIQDLNRVAEERLAIINRLDEENGRLKNSLDHAAPDGAGDLLGKQQEIIATRLMAATCTQSLIEKENEIKATHLIAAERERALSEKEYVIQELHAVAEERGRVLRLIDSELARIKGHWAYRMAARINRMLQKIGF